MTSNPKPNHPRRVASGAIWLVYRWKLPSKVDQCMNRHLRPFCSHDLDIDPVTFIYELDLYSWRYAGGAKMNFLHQGFRKYRLTYKTDRQTRLKLYTTRPCRYTEPCSKLCRSWRSQLRDIKAGIPHWKEMSASLEARVIVAQRSVYRQKRRHMRMNV